MPKVTIYTQAYNPGEYLKPCIESVLNQTYTDFEWILIDNASTDGTPALIDAYAEKDWRIIPIHMKQNTPFSHMFYRVLREHGRGQYFAYLDSDDWWDLDYLECLVPFAEENDLDLALTGVIEYFQQPGRSRVMRQIRRPVVMTLDDFARNFPQIGAFNGALWANLRHMDKVLALADDPKEIELKEKRLVWRDDTLQMLNYAEHCRRIGINQFTHYYYRRHAGSLSGQYRDSLFESNIYFYQRLEEFFEKHNVLDKKTTQYLNKRYFFEMISTLSLLGGSHMSANQKLRSCAQMVTHPLTLQALSDNSTDQTEWRKDMCSLIEKALYSGQFIEVSILREILRPLAPDCCDVITKDGLALFVQERDLFRILFQNDKKALLRRFLELIEKEKKPEQFDLGTMLCSVLPVGSPLRTVKDIRFFKHYLQLTQLILGSGYLVALDQMTALLLEEKPLESEEPFLRLYLTLAALENQPSAFVFGKVRLARLYQSQYRVPECQATLDELEEMGVGELPEVLALKENLGGEVQL